MQTWLQYFIWLCNYNCIIIPVRHHGDIIDYIPFNKNECDSYHDNYFISIGQKLYVNRILYIKESSGYVIENDKIIYKNNKNYDENFIENIILLNALDIPQSQFGNNKYNAINIGKYYFSYDDIENESYYKYNKMPIYGNIFTFHDYSGTNNVAIGSNKYACPNLLLGILGKLYGIINMKTNIFNISTVDIENIIINLILLKLMNKEYDNNTIITLIRKKLQDIKHFYLDR
jgi:hypothetical protein